MARGTRWRGGPKATSQKQHNSIKGAAQIASFEPRSGVIHSAVHARKGWSASELLRDHCVRSTAPSSVFGPVTNFARNRHWPAARYTRGGSKASKQSNNQRGGRLSGHSAAEIWSYTLTKELTRDLWAIFPMRYRSFDGAQFSLASRDIFCDKSRLACCTKCGGGSKASKQL